MKLHLFIVAFILLNSNLFASPLRTQLSQEKAEEQGTLKLGEAQARTLGPGTVHVWSITLESGQYAVVEVLQKGIDVVVRIVDPNGSRKREIDSPTGASGTEKASWITATAGKWKMEIVPLEAKKSGDYEIKLEILREATAKDRMNVEADSLGNVALTFYVEGKYADAEPLYKQSLAIREKALGMGHPEVAETLNNLALLYKTQGKYGEAESLYKRSLEMWEKVLGSDHPDVATSLNNLALLYKDQGKYDKAELLYKRSLAIREKALEPDHPDIGTSLNNLAELYLAQGKYAEAEPLYKHSLTLSEKALGPHHPSVATILNNLAGFYYDRGKYSEAETFFKRSLAILEKTVGSDHPYVAQSLSNLALLCYVQGKYVEAEQLYRRSLAILERALGLEHPAVAGQLHNLAALYRTQGKYAEAEPLYQRALTIYKKALGANHPNVARSLNGLAALYDDQDKDNEAEALFERALVIREKAMGLNHPDVAISLNNLAKLYSDQGKYAKAESLFTRSLSIWEIALGSNNPNVAMSLNNLAQVMFFEHGENLENVLPLVDRAIRIWDTSAGHPDRRLDAYALRAQIRRKKRDLDGALADLTEALRSAENLRLQIGIGEEIRASLFERYTDHFNRMVVWQIEAGQIEKSLKYAERSRARVLLDHLATSQVDLRSSIPADIRASLEERESDTKARLAEYQIRIIKMRSRKDLSEKEKQHQIAALQDSLHAADRDYQQAYDEIKNASPLWRNLITSSGQPVALPTIQRELVPKSGLMLLYQIGKEGSYLFIIPPEGQQPEVVPLQVTDKVASVLGMKTGPLQSIGLQKIVAGSNDSSKFDIGLREYLSSSPDSITSSQKQSAETKLQALWQVLVPAPVWQRLVTCTEVIIIPDGALHLLPFEALVTQIGSTRSDLRYWLDEGPIIRYAPSATSLYSFEQRKPAPTNHGQGETVISLAFAIFDVEGQKSNSDESRGRFESASEPLQPLPWTKEETNGIREAFQVSKGKETVRILLGRDATEHNLRTAMPGKYYVHIATHGLVEEKRQDSFIALALTPPSSTETPVVENDGFLRLNEIYELKIPTCELAVLSACETNVGPSFEGEGVFALSRGFLAAGAHRVVASQWKVQDKSTARLMGTFFQKIAAAEKTGEQIEYARALRDAKRELRKKKTAAAPYFWAPFIIMGKR